MARLCESSNKTPARQTRKGAGRFFGLLDEEDRAVMMCPGGTGLLQLLRLGFADRREIGDLLHVET
jgi:hypothetical protein